MSQRIAKVESLVQHEVAGALLEMLEGDAASVTVTRVDVSPDMRHAIIWIGLIGTKMQQEKMFSRLESARSVLQARVARKTTAKFAPQLALKRDSGGEYAAEIDRLLRRL